jgi:hypothetical protein
MNLTASDRSALIKLAGALPKGDGNRRALLASLRKESALSAQKLMEELFAFRYSLDEVSASQPTRTQAMSSIQALLDLGVDFRPKGYTDPNWDEAYDGSKLIAEIATSTANSRRHPGGSAPHFLRLKKIMQTMR